MLKNEVTGDIIILAEERTGAGRPFEIMLKCSRGHFTSDLCDFVVMGPKLKRLPRNGFCAVCGSLAAACQTEEAAV